jgi:protein-S-isoprenylcysteine O-methyltransferase Ste14
LEDAVGMMRHFAPRRAGRQSAKLASSRAIHYWGEQRALAGMKFASTGIRNITIEHNDRLTRREVPMMACLFAHLFWIGPEIPPFMAVRYLWYVFILFWFVSALKRKKTKQRESIVQRLVYVAPLIIAVLLLYDGRADFGWLATYFVPHTLTAQWAGVAIMALGLAMAIWARVHLGSNWSGVVTLKEGHELIRTGPYRSIRHPIYTGILIGFLGNAIVNGQVRALIALAVIWASFYIKARREEALLRQEFGPKFDEHARLTGMFLPKIS